MNTALIFAGGTGQRMSARSKPKQFLELHGKPILIYTLEHFEFHPEIDRIAVVCLESWIDELGALLRRFDIRKAEKVVPGGATGQESILNGLLALEGVCRKDDIVLIHDGVRPFVTADLIARSIAAAKEYGAAVACEPVTESVAVSADGARIDAMPERSTLYAAKAPQAFRYGLVLQAYRRARDEGLRAVDSSHLLSALGYEMRIVPSSPNNIKITSPADFYIFRALCEAAENYQILGL